MVINSADILKDQSGEVMGHGTGTIFLFLCDDAENQGSGRVLEIGYDKGDPLGEPFSCSMEKLERLKIIGNLYRFIWTL